MPTLCSRCYSLFQEDPGVFSDVTHETFQDFQTAIDHGCYICSIIHESLKQKDPGQIQRKKGHDFKLKYYTSESAPSTHSVKHLDLLAKPNSGRPSDSDIFSFYLMPLVQSIDLGFEMHPTSGGMARVQHRSYRKIPDTASACETGQLAHSWLQNCLTKHIDCGPVDSSGWYPPRLLDISDWNPRLILAHPSRQLSGPYAVLSHCWGPDPNFITLTKARMGDFATKGIPMEELPANFRDAIQVCKWLKIRYLWIDSLCIIQSGEGSTNDWLYHVNSMMKIYKRSQVCIAASQASRATEPSCKYRAPDLIAPILIQLKENRRPDIKEKELPYYILIHDQLHIRGHRLCPLTYRGWAVQERMLSPRVLTIGSEQLFWHCSDNRSRNVCETFPEGIPFDLHEAGRSTLPSQITPEINKENSECWRDLIRLYSRCAFTRPDEDKLAAFAGLAEYMSINFGDQEYIAGFFRHELPRCLLWYVPTGEIPLNRPKQAKCYRAPSWSWAAMDTRTEFELYGAFPNVYIASITSYNVDLLEPHQRFGPIKYAELVLNAPLLPICWDTSSPVKFADKIRPAKAPDKHMRRSYTGLFDSEEDYLEDQLGVAILGIKYFSANKKVYCEGLIVRKVKEGANGEPDKYMRVGLGGVTGYTETELSTLARVEVILL